MPVMLCKIIAIKKERNIFFRLLFFSSQDRETAKRIIAVLDNIQDSQHIDIEVQEFISKGQRWLVNGLQRFNLNKIIHLTRMCYAFSLSNSTTQKDLIAANIKHFISEINTRGSLDVNMALLIAPGKIISAYRNKNPAGILEALNDYRQTLEQPLYARGMFKIEKPAINKNVFRTIDAAALTQALSRPNVSARAAGGKTLIAKIRRTYRNIRPVIRDSYRILTGLSLAAAFFTLFPAVDFPLPDVVLANALLNIGTNSVMLWVSARGHRFWQYRLADLNSIKLSQSVMYSSLGLPLTQSAAFLLKSIPAGTDNLLFSNALTLLGVGLVGAIYTFLNNKARGKNPLETRLNTLRPVFGNAAAIGIVTALGGIPQNYLTLVSIIMGNVYRLIVEGTINYALYKKFIYKNLGQLQLESAGAEQLIKFNLEAMSFIESAGGASAVQGYLQTMNPLLLGELFRKLGRDRSRHLANIQNYSYTDSLQAEYYFAHTYFLYRAMLALAMRRTGKIKKIDSLEKAESAQAELDRLILRLNSIPAAKARILQEEAISKAFGQIQEMSAKQINAAALDLYLVFKKKVTAGIQGYIDNLTEEQLVSGMADLLQQAYSPAFYPAARRLLAIYVNTLVKKTQADQAKHIIYKGLL
ncbi:MAG: hypothetical protein LBQ83_03110 [Candidatus Margulisbacteria bacterium]|jgi:hypothetical protein|nr:hypothetical protein [Candidatus Margulisiibacteriota bacterium]